MLIEVSITKGIKDWLHIVPITEHDLLEVVEIEESCGLSTWGWEAYYAELEKGSIVLGARRVNTDWKEDTQILGFISAALVVDELHVHNIGVRPTCQKKGIGSSLLKAAIREGIKRGIKAAFLEVRASNLAAQALYRKYGFKVVGTRENYYLDPPEAAVNMRADFWPT
jgi:[ribosomal protein S18]-alanine N-acetyltransferase